MIFKRKVKGWPNDPSHLLTVCFQGLYTLMGKADTKKNFGIIITH
jgi:hypothetical protein